jgi:hypothetical protein
MTPGNPFIARGRDYQWSEFGVTAAKLKHTFEGLSIESPGFHPDCPLAPASLEDRIHLQRLLPPVCNPLALIDAES